METNLNSFEILRKVVEDPSLLDSTRKIAFNLHWKSLSKEEKLHLYAIAPACLPEMACEMERWLAHSV